MAMERRQYTAEFKRDAVRLMTQGGQSASEVAHALGINSKLLGKWKRQLVQAQEAQASGRSGYEAFPGQGRAHDEELASAQGAPGGGRMQRSKWSVMC